MVPLNSNIFTQEFPSIQTHVPLAPFTSMGIGGMADFYYKLKDIQELPTLIKVAQKNNIPALLFGGGTNTIFADEGFRGLIIHMQANHITHENNTVIAESGALLSQVIQYALKQNLSGMEKLMGLPGTVGGAVRGNAGAFGVEISQVFKKAVLYSKEKGFFEADKKYFDFHYRYSTIKKSHETIIKVFLELEQKDTKKALAEALDIVKNRISKQPKGKCSGSFFKNPDPFNEKLKAGYLLEQAGCKGLIIGNAQVSPQHANWIMNIGGATQKEILELKTIMTQKVKDRFNLVLEPEVQFIGTTDFL